MIMRSIKRFVFMCSLMMMMIPQLTVGPQVWELGEDQVLEYDEDTNWCVNTYCGHAHTMCTYPSELPSGDCQNFVRYNLTSSYQMMILHFLNYRRNMVAGGYEYRLPSAGGMRMLQWDDTLALFAERWMVQCIYHPAKRAYRPLTDFCRDHPKYNVIQYGASIFGSRNAPDWTVLDLITFLIDWISSDGEAVSNHVLHSGYIPLEDEGAVFFYASSYKVGCAAASFDVYSTESKMYDRLSQIICNLGPLEDFYLQDPYYEVGTPCSSCPKNTACDPASNFKFLCQSAEIQSTYYDEKDDVEEGNRQAEADVPYSVFDSIISTFAWL